jgi:hypothetical protein
MELDFPQLHQGAVTGLGRPISDQRLRSFSFIKLYFKSTIIIDYSVKLGHYLTTVNPNPSLHKLSLLVCYWFNTYW